MALCSSTSACLGDMYVFGSLFCVLSWSLLGGFTHLGVAPNGEAWASTGWLATMPLVWSASQLRVKLGGITYGCAATLNDCHCLSLLALVAPQERAGSMTMRDKCRGVPVLRPVTPFFARELES